MPLCLALSLFHSHFFPLRLHKKALYVYQYITHVLVYHINKNNNNNNMKDESKLVNMSLLQTIKCHLILKFDCKSSERWWPIFLISTGVLFYDAMRCSNGNIYYILMCLYYLLTCTSLHVSIEHGTFPDSCPGLHKQLPAIKNKLFSHFRTIFCIFTSMCQQNCVLLCIIMSLCLYKNKSKTMCYWSFSSASFHVCISVELEN